MRYHIVNRYASVSRGFCRDRGSRADRLQVFLRLQERVAVSEGFIVVPADRIRFLDRESARVPVTARV
jgi:hypothetical protein